MIVTDLFKGAVTATAQVEKDIVAVCVIHSADEPPVVFEMYVDKLANFLDQCRREQMRRSS